MSEEYIISSVKNAMRVLRLFTPNQTELGLTSIARQIGVPKSTAHRIVTLLVNDKFLSKSPKTRKYRLGLSLLTLGGVVFTHREIYKEALPIVRSLVDTVNETAHICFLENDEVTYLFRKESDRQNRLITYIGRKNPIHCTSEGLCILAFQDKKVIERVLSKPLFSYTSTTFTDPEQIQEELANIRERGYAISKNQFYDGFIGIAAPIRDYSQNVVSSLSIIGSTSIVTTEQHPFFIKKLINAAAQISKQLGYYEFR